MKIFKNFALISLLVITMVACGFSSSEEMLDLNGSEWVLVSIDGEAIIPGSEITLIYEVDRIHGGGGCNNYFTNYTLSEDGNIEFGPAGSTMMFCQEPEGVMDQEFTYLQALAEVSEASIEGEQLILEGEAGSPRLVFQPSIVD